MEITRHSVGTIKVPSPASRNLRHVFFLYSYLEKFKDSPTGHPMDICGAQETNEERKSPTPPKPVSSASLRPPPETWSRPPSRNMSAASPVPPHHHPAQQQRQTFSAFRKARLAQLRRSRLRRLDQFRLNFSWSDGYIHRSDPLEMCRARGAHQGQKREMVTD